MLTGPGAQGNPLVAIVVPAKSSAGRVFEELVVTISGVTTLTSSESGLYYDSVTITSITTIPLGEFEFVHPSGFWGAFDVDNGQL